ncbi:hypothetical protein MROS_2316 [Melioribacter roseus P3M-2]|uniref:Alginate lyase domain-containing protein n=1 Tax=Melioribacter roseus (strain DSM 23840 / JCM 17771 / VKM B-2668 / P3M-2) TaxID=1191523 RepID=I7A6N7_MELRP|nr:hypothetical protein MROS_2316 [Melioribacter roseus P3M-2]
MGVNKNHIKMNKSKFNYLMRVVIFITVGISPSSLYSNSLYLFLQEKNIEISNPVKQKILDKAELLLFTKIATVTDKNQVPPSGDKHDYMSMAPYWWPNPNSKDGLPYIRKDGLRNPEIKKIPDRDNMRAMIDAVETQSLAYRITRENKYSKKAIEFLKAWFIDEQTKMNPNLNFAQFIPGVNTGRGIGIIEASSIYKIIDAIGILKMSEDWDPHFEYKIRKWFEDYFIWLTTSKNGIDESNEKIIMVHGMMCRLPQFHCFSGKLIMLKKLLKRSKQKELICKYNKMGNSLLKL